MLPLATPPKEARGRVVLLCDSAVCVCAKPERLDCSSSHRVASARDSAQQRGQHCGAPQCGHRLPSAAPHSPQNFFPAGFSLPQTAQVGIGNLARWQDLHRERHMPPQRGEVRRSKDGDNHIDRCVLEGR